MLVSHEALHVQLLAAGSFGLCLLGAGLSLDTHEPMVTTCCKFKIFGHAPTSAIGVFGVLDENYNK